MAHPGRVCFIAYTKEKIMLRGITWLDWEDATNRCQNWGSWPIQLTSANTACVTLCCSLAITVWGQKKVVYHLFHYYLEVCTLGDSDSSLNKSMDDQESDMNIHK